MEILITFLIKVRDSQTILLEGKTLPAKDFHSSVRHVSCILLNWKLNLIRIMKYDVKVSFPDLVLVFANFRASWTDITPKL